MTHPTEPNFKALFESAPNLYLVLDPNLDIVAVSDAYLQATMVRREKILGRNVFDVFPDNPDDPDSQGTAHLRASLNRVLNGKIPDVMAIQKYDVRRPESEGGGFEERHWSPLNAPVLNAHGQVEYIIHRVEDVTDFVKLKREGIEQYRLTEQIRSEKDQLEKLRQGQRLEAMGALAGGVAHDFNNILAIILMTAEQVMGDPNMPAPVQAQIQEILNTSEKAAALTRQLLAFSRKQVLQPKVVNLNTVISNIDRMLSRLLKENIDFKTILAADLKNIMVDAGQLEQVLLNLVLNARDAMPSGGKIIVETSNVVLDQVMASGNMRVEPGPYVMLTVRDTGIGMDARTQARVFEPFFTTKPAGKGTGLGLATVYGIVSQNRGSVWVYSELNKGSVFKIYFPQVNQEIESAVPAKEQVSSKLDATGKTIMVVEDLEALRKVMTSALTAKGYKVVAVENGVAALKALSAMDYRIDLLITDVVMPEMGGQELVARLSSRGRKLKTLYLSGFTGDTLVDYDTAGDSIQFLEKPFTNKALLAKVQALI